MAVIPWRKNFMDELRLIAVRIFPQIPTVFWLDGGTIYPSY